MPNWDEDSPQLRANLTQILEEIAAAAEQRKKPTVEAARRWQAIAMRNLEVREARFVGAFRGEPGLENVNVRVGANYGVDPADVGEALKQFEAKLQMLVAELDAVLPAGQALNSDQLAAIIDLCAWAHSEWVRIHPFANGNGRTARFWANSLAMRYGLPPFIRLRPRPNASYGQAGAKAMQGDWKPTAVVFHRLLEDFLAEQ
ncbi:MAG TPA: Fic family protein [Candidatus Binatia bacterium]|nr:Fic family protein [Candidatus Binatia bacterium]